MRSMGRVRGSGHEHGISSNAAAVAPPPHPNLSPRGEEIGYSASHAPFPLRLAARSAFSQRKSSAWRAASRAAPSRVDQS